MSQGSTKGLPIDTDASLALNSDLVVASQKAVKSHVAAAINAIPAAAVPPIRITIGDGSAPIVASAVPVYYISMPNARTITGWRALADVSGSIEVELWADTYANHPPTVADKITASAPISITSATKNENSTLTGWTTSLAAGSVLAVKVNSASTVTLVTITITLA